MIIYFEAGSFTSCVIGLAPLSYDGYIMRLQQKKGGVQVLETQRGRERVFKTYDAAVSVAKEIGFRRIIVLIA